MSINGDVNSHDGFHAIDHQPAYIYTPVDAPDIVSERPTKRRKIGKPKGSIADAQENVEVYKFDPLLNDRERPECVSLRQQLFESSWADTDAQIQSVLDEANEDTLAEVTSFVNGAREAEDRVPAGFIVTGPNITSQGLLFQQLSTRLKAKINGPVVILQSGDSSNLKAILKKLIREATSQKPGLDEDEELSFEQDGRKLLNYDLEILHGFIKTHGSQSAVVAFQDSEAFDTTLLAELIILFNSWVDRIPFVLLFGIATSVDLFYERLSRAASRCLYSRQFDVEQTRTVLERIFQKAVAGSKAPLKLSTRLASSLMERQNDHVQSVQSFTAALKFAYMCHFYGNAVSILNEAARPGNRLWDIIHNEHLEAVRMLPSFRKQVEAQIQSGKTARARALLEDVEVLMGDIEDSLALKDKTINRILRVIHIIACSSPEPVGMIDLYMTAFDGTISESDFVRRILESIKRMTPDDLIAFSQKIRKSIEIGCPEMDVEGWADQDSQFLGEIADIESQVTSLVGESKASGQPVRSSYAIHSKGVRTTVIAQRVQLSYEKSTLSEQDKELTALVDRLSEHLTEYFTCDRPQDLPLHEIWLYDSTSPYKEVITPRPRAAIERALSAPQDYLNCKCCKSREGCSPTQPATAIIYQMYLEAGSLINIADLWTAFLDNQSGNEGEVVDERESLVLFYRALADLKLLGMVKQSKKKADHLAKVAWNGL